MIRTYKTLAAAGMLAAAGLTAQAHGQERMLFQPDEVVVGGSEQRGFGVIALDPVDMGAAVYDAPYSAEAVTEVTQVLADGNRIERRTSAAIARNAQGRTRREQSGVPLGTFMAPSTQPIVTITDPKSGVHLTLNYEQKVAYRMKPSRARLAMPAGSGAGIAYGSAGLAGRRGPDEPLREPAFQAGRLVLPPPPPPGTFDVVPNGEPITPVMVTSASASAIAASPLVWEGTVRSEVLEAREIEGVRAEGVRTIMTIPAGTIGNALPIEVVNERWVSPELRVVVMTRRFDPRFGETVYRLTNIVRSEPSADLFRVPADFRTEDVRP